MAGKAYFEAMPSKPIELPPDVAKAFVEDMRAFFAEKNAVKRDQIAGDAAFLLGPLVEEKRN